MRGRQLVIQGIWMRFTFVCPTAGRHFDTDDFRLVENRGVVVDADGSRRLDARVRLGRHCPYCGAIHEYPADELACPFGGGLEGT
jgi:hypothetical protein